MSDADRYRVRYYARMHSHFAPDLQEKLNLIPVNEKVISVVQDQDNGAEHGSLPRYLIELLN